MRTGDSAGQAKAPCFGREGLDMARERIIRLIAMEINPEATLGGDFAQSSNGPATILHRALEMRYSPNNIHSQIERADGVGLGIGAAIETVLGKSDDLQIEIGGN